MIQLCVIGNSHLAAYKLGWDALVAAGVPVSRAIKPTFFGAPRDGIRQVKQEAGRIVPTRRDVADGFERMSGGHREIHLADYNAVLLVGLSVSVKRILRFYKTHWWYGLSADPARVMVPSRFVREFLTKRYRETLLFETAMKVREGTDAPIVAVAEPFWASKVLHDNGNKPDYGWSSAVRNGDSGRLGEMFQACVDGALKGQAVFVPQATRTIEDSILTRAEFNKDASRLISGTGGETDAAHMNGDFGCAMWPLVVDAVVSSDLTSIA